MQTTQTNKDRLKMRPNGKHVLKVDVEPHTMDTVINLARATGKSVDHIIDAAVDLVAGHYSEVDWI